MSFLATHPASQFPFLFPPKARSSIKGLDACGRTSLMLRSFCGEFHLGPNSGVRKPDFRAVLVLLVFSFKYSCPRAHSSPLWLFSESSSSAPALPALLPTHLGYMGIEGKEHATLGIAKAVDPWGNLGRPWFPSQGEQGAILRVASLGQFLPPGK